MQKNIELVNLLIKKHYKISFAESCTGGMMASTIVDVEDASKVFDGSFITYANENKIKYVDVNPKTIEEKGVVSKEVAIEMAIGTVKANESQVGVGISGIAGPTGGTKEKPIGMVCFGYYINGQIFSEAVQFGNIGRNKVRKKSVEHVLEVLISHLK